MVDPREVERDPFAGADRRRPHGRRAGSTGPAPPRRPVARPSADRRARHHRPSVPVTTVPLPAAANTRSTQSRARPRSSAAARRATPVRRGRCAAASSPRPVTVDTATTGAASRNVPSTRSATSSSASSSRSASTRSAFVSAINPCSMPEQLRGSGDVPPTAASSPRSHRRRTRRPTRRPRRPACWAGTARGPARRRSSPPRPRAGRCGRSRGRSSDPAASPPASRSGSVPVRASTSDDFPWSTCPAVAMTVIGPVARRRRRARRARPRR